MGVEKFLALGRSGFAVALCAMLLPQCASAFSGTSAGHAAPQNGAMAQQIYNPAFVLAPGLAPAIGNMWTAGSGYGAWTAVPIYHSTDNATAFTENPNSPSFDTGGYDVMWDDSKFSEIAAYGGLARDALRIAGMHAIDGSDGVSGAIPYGHLTLQRDFLDGQDRLTLGAYGTQVGVRQAAISGFGDDSYTDIAIDGTWRWIAHPERSNSQTISAHLLMLHEDENLIASHAIFGTNKNDELTVFRGDASWSWGSNIAPTVQYFRMTGSADPIRLGTPDGIPDSKGFIAGIDYLPSDDARSPLNWFNVRLSLQFIAYTEFDGSSLDASQNNTVLLHLTADTD